MPHPLPGSPQPLKPELTLLADTEVTMMTFGGKEVYLDDKGEVFPFSLMIARNRYYVVVQSGCNFYVFPAEKVQIHGESGPASDNPMPLEEILTHRCSGCKKLCFPPDLAAGLCWHCRRKPAV